LRTSHGIRRDGIDRQNKRVADAVGGPKGRKGQMRTRLLVGIVVALHALAVGGILFMQGCGTTKGTAAVEPPPAPVMPPKAEVVPPTPPPARPVFQPPAPAHMEPPMKEPTEVKTYTIQAGDSLSKIASWYGVSSREIAELNGLKNVNVIKPGQTLVLPAYAKATPKPPPARHTHKAKPPSEGEASAGVAPAEGGAEYVVKSGDVLSKIASAHGIKTKDLREANNLTSDSLRVGQKLTIPGAKAEEAAAPEAAAPAEAAGGTPAGIAEPAAPAGQNQPIVYTVQEGDKLDDIAKLFTVSRDDIIKLNNLTDPENLKTGTRLKVPVAAP
jgi:LysM repeat protein